jgi:hypothetical protein
VYHYFGAQSRTSAQRSIWTVAVFRSRRVFVRVRLRSSAVEIPVDPGRLSYVIVSHRGGQYEPGFVVTEDGVSRPWTGSPDPLRAGESVELGLEFVSPYGAKTRPT